MRRAHTITIIAGLAVLSAGVVYYVTGGALRSPVPTSAGSREAFLVTPAPPIAKPKAAYYRIGFVPRDFPRYFLPEGAYATLSARRLTYASGTQQAVISYQIPWSIENAILFHTRILQEHAWTIQSQSVGARYGTLYALKSSESFYATWTLEVAGRTRVTAVWTKTK